MSPIFVRPVREQLEHDRLIRFLQNNKYKRKFEVAVNVGDEQAAPVKLGAQTFYPDLVLTEGKRLAGLVEVETGESINNLEAMAQWVHFGRSRVAFHLYVPIPGYDTARRLCEQNGVAVSEIWTYRASMDGFDLVRVYSDSSAAGVAARESSRRPVSAPAAKASQPERAAPRPAERTTSRPTERPAPRRKPGKAASAKPAPKPSRPSRTAKTARPAKSAGPAARSARKPARPKKSAASKR